jgi:hypothetical protein
MSKYETESQSFECYGAFKTKVIDNNKRKNNLISLFLLNLTHVNLQNIDIL